MAECPLGLAAAEQSAPFQTRVQEVASEQPGVRVFVVESEERLAYERGEREKAMGRVQPQLEALRRRVAGGKLKTPEKIGAAAQRVLHAITALATTTGSWRRDSSNTLSIRCTCDRSRRWKANT